MKKNLLICLLAVLGFLVLSYAFVPQVLGGKIVNQGDISGWQGMSHEKLEWEKAHPGQNAAWTGSMFSGMPTASIQSSTKGDWTQKIYDFLTSHLSVPEALETIESNPSSQHPHCSFDLQGCKSSSCKGFKITDGQVVFIK